MSVPESYVKQLCAMQTRLYAYILTLLADTTAAEDVLQETNLVLYCKAGEFVEGTDFEAWAFRIARNQCLAYWTLRGRDRLVLNENAIYGSAGPSESDRAELERRREALNECLGALPPRQRELVQARYAPGGSVKRLAELWGRTESAISQSLYRIRSALLRCIRERLAQDSRQQTA